MENLAFPADIFFNLHKRVWSVRNRSTGRVERHARVVVLATGAHLVVQPAGREKTIRTGQKNVHAFVRGRDAGIQSDTAGWLSFVTGLTTACRITYNPKRADHFTRVDTGERIDAASAVVMIAPPDGPPQVWALPATAEKSA